jgi:transposase-like protein
MKEMSQDKPRRTFTPEFKLDVVKEANADQSSISAIARKYDLNANQVFRWCHEVKQNKVRWVRIVAGEQALSKLPAPTPTFLPVSLSRQTVAHQSTQTTSPILTFEFANGHRVQLHQDNPELLKQLLAVML